MSRATAESLVLVNWKGVFYARYQLDRHVTALEGANGAGKTTVMIAAYLVLLPDLTRLKFTNLGESGATGGDRGIYGRLGAEGGPAYALVEFRTGRGARVLAGVQLVRRGEPTVDLHTFIITGLADDVGLQELVLQRVGTREQVPELDELRDAVAGVGGHLARFSTAKEYFAALFELNITPLRLAADEERKNFNDMLRTSMTGGISRTLTNDLRTFLLKQESTLGETLASMRESLAACRTTRSRVHTTQALQAEIRGVYEAGEQMFAAAYHATRERSEEARRAAESARAAYETARAELRVATEALEALAERASTVEARLAEARTTATQAAAHREKVESARRIVVRLAALVKVADEQRLDADSKLRASEAAQQRFQEAGLIRERADDAWSRAAQGLADVERGIDELFRRAAEHRRTVAQLERAGTLMGVELVPEVLGTVHADVQRERPVRDAEAARIDADIRTAEQRRGTYEAVVAALERIVGGPVDASLRPSRARDEHARLTSLGSLVEREGALARQAREAAALAQKQAATRDVATRLGVESTSAAVAAAAAQAARRLEERTEGARAEEAKAAQARRDREAARERLQALELRTARWGEALDCVARVGDAVEDVASADRVAARLTNERDIVNAAITAAAAARDEATNAAQALQTSGGPFAVSLSRIAERVGGELLAARYDDVQPEAAGALQAQLGPLADAIVVDDAVAVARQIADADRDVETVRLLEPDVATAIATTGEVSSRDVVTHEAGVVRVTRIPSQPTLGRRARAQRVADLRAEAARHEAERLARVAQRGEIDGRIQALTSLRGLLDVLIAGDPAPAVADAKAQLAAAATAITQHEGAAESARGEVERAKTRAGALQALLVDAHLLDPPDRGYLAHELAEQHAAAVRAKAEIARTRDDLAILARGLVDLEQPPPTPAEVAALRERLTAVVVRRTALFEADEALTFVREHRDALSWTDAAPRLEAGRALVPELKAAEQTTKAAAEAARSEENTARDVWATAVSAAQKANGEALTAESARDAARSNLADIGVGEPTEEDVASTFASATAAEAEHERVQKERDTVAGERATAAAKHTTATNNEAARGKEYNSLEQEAAPHEERWRALRESATQKSALTATQARRYIELFTGSGTPKLNTLARTAGAQLVERLRHAQRADEVFATVKAWVESEEDRSGDGYLTVWLQVLDWLRRRLPAHIADVDDPVASLRLLAEELASLEATLEGQEARLRGESADVASTIEVQIRKANGKVHRLNKLLGGVAFGSIGAIRIEMGHVETMGRILRALREGHGQELLFEPGLPIEEALDLLFQRYGGAGGSGQKVLDYREYIQLNAEIKRKASTTWESASATRLSTGEAIGVGAAIMMVVLAEWERDANALRPKKSDGSLRFLFLDEANRLDRGNLDEVFELCRTLELQLLIAAPEVARAEGTTTYRLARVVDGQDEQVVMSGRRTRSHRPGEA